MMGIEEVTSSLDAEQSAKFTASIREATTKDEGISRYFWDFISYRELRKVAYLYSQIQHITTQREQSPMDI